MIVLTIGVGSQDTTITNNYYPDTSSRDSRKCIVKQAHINQMAEEVNSKFDSIHVKYDQGIEDILRLLDEIPDSLNHK